MTGTNEMVQEEPIAFIPNTKHLKNTSRRSGKSQSLENLSVSAGSPSVVQKVGNTSVDVSRTSDVNIKLNQAEAN